VRGNHSTVIREEKIAEPFQVAVVVFEHALGNRVQDAVGIGLVEVPSRGQGRHVLPIPDLEAPRGTALIGQRRRQTLSPLLREGFPLRFHDPSKLVNQFLPLRSISHGRGQGFEPIIEPFIPGETQELAGERSRDPVSSEEPPGRQKVADPVNGIGFMRMFFGQLQKGLVDFPAQHPGPEFDRMVKVGILDWIGGHVTKRGIEEDGRCFFLRREACYQRPMPEHLMVPHHHGRVKKPIPKEPSLFNCVDGGMNLLRGRLGPVQDEAKFLTPDLGVLGHGLPVQVQVGRLGAEENMQDPIFPGSDFELVLTPVNPGPAVGSLEGAADGAVSAGGQGTVRAGFVDPARLGDPQAMGSFVADHDVQEGNLAGQGYFLSKLPIAGDPPEQQAAGKRQEVELLRQVGFSDLRR